MLLRDLNTIKFRKIATLIAQDPKIDGVDKTGLNLLLHILENADKLNMVCHELKKLQAINLAATVTAPPTIDKTVVAAAASAATSMTLTNRLTQASPLIKQHDLISSFYLYIQMAGAANEKLSRLFSSRYPELATALFDETQDGYGMATLSRFAGAHTASLTKLITDHTSEIEETYLDALNKRIIPVILKVFLKFRTIYIELVKPGPDIPFCLGKSVDLAQPIYQVRVVGTAFYVLEAIKTIDLFTCCVEYTPDTASQARQRFHASSPIQNLSIFALQTIGENLLQLRRLNDARVKVPFGTDVFIDFRNYRSAHTTTEANILGNLDYLWNVLIMPMIALKAKLLIMLNILAPQVHSTYANNRTIIDIADEDVVAVALTADSKGGNAEISNHGIQGKKVDEKQHINRKEPKPNVSQKSIELEELISLINAMHKPQNDQHAKPFKIQNITNELVCEFLFLSAETLNIESFKMLLDSILPILSRHLNIKAILNRPLKFRFVKSMPAEKPDHRIKEFTLKNAAISKLDIKIPCLNIYKRDSLEVTILTFMHDAMMQREHSQAQLNECMQCFALMLSYGANPNCYSCDNATSLIHQVMMIPGARIELVQLLLQYGADYNAQVDIDAQVGCPGNVLAAACIRNFDNKELLKLLLDAGADPLKPILWQNGQGEVLQHTLLVEVAASASIPEKARLEIIKFICINVYQTYGREALIEYINTPIIWKEVPQAFKALLKKPSGAEPYSIVLNGRIFTHHPKSNELHEQAPLTNPNAVRDFNSISTFISNLLLILNNIGRNVMHHLVLFANLDIIKQKLGTQEEDSANKLPINKSFQVGHLLDKAFPTPLPKVDDMVRFAHNFALVLGLREIGEYLNTEVRKAHGTYAVMTIHLKFLKANGCNPIDLCLSYVGIDVLEQTNISSQPDKATKTRITNETAVMAAALPPSFSQQVNKPSTGFTIELA